LSPTCRVARDYDRAYSDPVTFAAGEPVELGRQDEEYAGWIWCTDSRGKSGWAPVDVVDRETGRALSDYNAQELSARAGETVGIEHSAHGWAWAIKSNGEAGWLPLAHLEEIDR
jgi:hypothetical protein